MMLIEWREDRFAVHHEAIDSTHREFVALVNQAAGCADKAAFMAAFAALLAHTITHFEMEESLMASSHFPATAEHKAEHARVLTQMRQFNERVQRGITRFGREMLKEMPSWFELHAITMDSALAAHLQTH